MNGREREIASRVRKIRFANQLSLPAFAHALRTSRDRIASIEYARTPLPVELADKICSRFDVSVTWLANGTGSEKPQLGEILKSCPRIDGSELLSKAFSPDVERLVLTKYRDNSDYSMFLWEVIQSDSGAFKKDVAEKYLERFQRDLNEYFLSLPHVGREKFLAFMLRKMSRFSLDWELGLQEYPGWTNDEIEKKSLTDGSLKGKTSGVKSEIQKLIEQVKRKASQPGAKADLARTLEVAPARISEWLSGKKEPGGDYALRLLNWVKSPARQK